MRAMKRRKNQRAAVYGHEIETARVTRTAAFVVAVALSVPVYLLLLAIELVFL